METQSAFERLWCVASHTDMTIKKGAAMYKTRVADMSVAEDDERSNRQRDKTVRK